MICRALDVAASAQGEVMRVALEYSSTGGGVGSVDDQVWQVWKIGPSGFLLWTIRFR
jgi:hypothetical protein